MTAPSIPSNPAIIAHEGTEEHQEEEEFNVNSITVPPNNNLTKSKLII